VEGKHFVGNGKAQLAQLKLYPEQKHEEFDAVYSPLPWIPIVPTDKTKFKVTDDCPHELSTISTSQPYVYRSKLKWYILHPEQIEAPQLHKQRWWWRARVFDVNGERFVGNGNHRVCAALLLGVCQPGPKRGAESPPSVAGGNSLQEKIK